MSGSAAPFRVLVVDDSAFIRRAVERMLEPMKRVEIAGFATNGAEALEEVRRLQPELVLMDVNMPEMDGLQALERIMAERPTPVLLLSTVTKPGAEATLRGLELGALDVIDKGSTGGGPMDIFELAPLLREKVEGIMGSRRVPAPVPAPEPSPPTLPTPAPEPRAASPYQVVAIGCSTGGPRALAEVLPSLPAGFGAGVVVAQHMPAGFTDTFAERMDRRCRLSVREAADGDEVRPGEVLIAPGRREIRVEKEDGRTRVRISDGGDRIHQPSVDVLFSSLANAVGAAAIGVVLTGMGEDGARGLQRLRDAGGRTIVESETTAVIDGMPAAARHAAETVLPLPRIGPALADLCAAGTSALHAS